MPIAYVYAALNASIRQINTGGHLTCTDGGTPSGNKPIDLGAGSGTAIKLYVNYPTVQSISYSITTGNPFECCDSLDIPGNQILEDHLKRAVKVTLYALPNMACQIGWVLFGHINQSGFSLVSGNITNGNCGQLGTVIFVNPPGYTCYTGSHLHMECNASGQYGQTFAVGNNVTGGTTPLFKWTNIPC